MQIHAEGLQRARISDVLDLIWMITGPLKLRSVQELLERLTADILPGTPVRFRSYDEPRYRSALQLQIADMPASAATGVCWPNGRGVHVEPTRLICASSSSRGRP